MCGKKVRPTLVIKTNKASCCCSCWRWCWQLVVLSIVYCLLFVVCWLLVAGGGAGGAGGAGGGGGGGGGGGCCCCCCIVWNILTKLTRMHRPSWAAWTGILRRSFT